MKEVRPRGGKSVTEDGLEEGVEDLVRTPFSLISWLL